MINVYSIGFVLTAATLVAGVDYYDQTSKAGLSLGQMSPGAYIETIPNRFASVKEEKLSENAERERKSRWRQGGMPFLPEAPEGWTRRALLEGDDTSILPPEATENGSMSDTAGKGFLEQMNASKHIKQQKERAKRSWIYERGTETVFVEVRVVERPSTDSLFGIVASAMDGVMLGAFEKNIGYGIFGGFALTEKLAHDGKRPYHFRYLEGAIGFGSEVHLRVHANASREATYEILSRIDYDGLNSLLPRPMASVGNDATVPHGIDPAELSMELRRLKSEFLNLRSLEAQYRIENLDTNALVLNAYTNRLGGEGGVDLTGGKVSNLSSLVEQGYYTAVEAVMAGKSAKEVQAEVKQMVDTVMQVADAETAAAAARAENAPEPEMSPELKAELVALTADNRQQAALEPRPGVKDTAGSQGEDMAEIAAKNRARDMKTSEGGKLLMQVDEAASDQAAGKIYSKAIDLLEYEKFKDVRGATEVEMQMSMTIVAAGFEKEHDLGSGTCQFDAARLRMDCDSARAAEGDGALSGLLSKLTGGTSASQVQTPGGAQADEKPRRLELSNSKSGSGSRCVGSFCD